MRSGTLFPLFAFKKSKKRHIESRKITEREKKHKKNSQKGSGDSGRNSGGVFACVDNGNRSWTGILSR